MQMFHTISFEIQKNTLLLEPILKIKKSQKIYILIFCKSERICFFALFHAMVSSTERLSGKVLQIPDAVMIVGRLMHKGICRF